MAKALATVLAKWRNGMANAGESVRAGVNAVQRNPAEAAIEKESTMRARLLAAIDSGKWRANLGKRTLQQWKDDMLNKGLARMQDGAQKGEKKMSEFLSQFLPFVANLRDQIRQMPNVTDSDREARMIANVRGMRQFQKQ